MRESFSEYIVFNFISFISFHLKLLENVLVSSNFPLSNPFISDRTKEHANELVDLSACVCVLICICICVIHIPFQHTVFEILLILALEYFAIKFESETIEIPTIPRIPKRRTETFVFCHCWIWLLLGSYEYYIVYGSIQM